MTELVIFSVFSQVAVDEYLTWTEDRKKIRPKSVFVYKKTVKIASKVHTMGQKSNFDHFLALFGSKMALLGI